jgi:uncharacterized integral membrane protein (TIGR00698 family)
MRLEDVPTTATAAATDPTRWQVRRASARSKLPGLAIVAAIALAATGIGKLAPLLGAPVAGILLGVALSAAVRPRTTLRPGISASSKFVLQLAVVVLGAQLSLRQVAHAGADSLPVMLGTLAVCLALAWWLGRRLGIDGDLRTLIGVGTAICGASAIAATSSVIKARGSAIAYAISTIFLFNVVAVLLFPPLGHLLGMSQHAFGLFAGTAVNDTSSVVAAATTYGADAGNYAVVVKLTRTLMIIPIVLVLAEIQRRRDASGTDAAAPVGVGRIVRLVPWFLIGFVAVAALNSAGLIPSASHHALQEAAVFLITMALAAIGLSTDVAELRRAGPRPLLLGGLLWLVVSATSLLLQWAAG